MGEMKVSAGMTKGVRQRTVNSCLNLLMNTLTRAILDFLGRHAVNFRTRMEFVVTKKLHNNKITC